VISSLPFIKKPSQLKTAGRPDMAEALESIRKPRPDYRFAVGLISLGLKSDAIEKSRQAHEGDNAHDGFSYFYFSQQDIKKKYKSLIEAEAGIPEDDLHFCGKHFEDDGEYGRAWVGSVSAAELQRLYAKHQEKLFAGNIRLFLGSRKGGINEQIIKTAKESPGIFWALNNGITIVADNAGPGAGNNASSTLKLKRFSIVNGCQTTSSLVRADASPSAKVMARVIAAKVGLKNEIVRYNNSQNAVKIWTVRAADDIQEQLRKEFSSAGITYAPKQEGSRKKKNPSIIELDKVTQYLASSEQKYIIQAIDNKSELFDEPYQKLFKKGIKASTVYLAWLTGSLADSERQKLVDGLGSDPNASLLGVTSGYWIVYCTYKILAKFSDINSPHLSLPKMKTNDFNGALKKYIIRAASMFYDAAVDTYDRDEYGSFKSTLRSAKFLQKIDSKINSRIVKLGPKSLPDLVSVYKSAKKE
jgi:AIPR protein